MNYQEKSAQKLEELRQVLAAQGLDGFIVPRTDEFQGEYVPACAERLAWLTGFTGSAGVAVILSDKAVVMSDGRYTIQLAAQVDIELYALKNSQTMPLESWLEEHAGDGLIVGYDPKLHTPAQIEKIEKAGVLLRPVAENLIDKIWQDRPAPPQAKVTLFPETFAGKSAAGKIDDIQTQIRAAGASAFVMTLPDSIAWLLNIRGSDVPHIPVALSYAIVPAEGKVQWFINADKITADVREVLENNVEFYPQEILPKALETLAKTHTPVWLDPKRSSVWFKSLLEEGGATLVTKDDPVIWPRAQKNAAEQAAMKAAHVRDGVALVKFLKWFESEAPSEQLTELSVEAKLESFRAAASEYIEPSFSTIAGFGSNGAIVHYRADKKSSKTITTNNLLLLDSGAQYEDGTTDITRTLSVGKPTAEMRDAFTLVLKGHIAIARAQFKAGAVGKDLDKLARAPLQAQGLDYAHGTGHGVGCHLSVHEESASISPRGEEVIKAGMILSNEPGYYKAGEYGIRIESLVLTVAAGENRLGFETITLAPIDKTLILADMLTDQEKAWLNDYHTRVCDTLAPLLDDETKGWLKDATAAI